MVEKSENLTQNPPSLLLQLLKVTNEQYDDWLSLLSNLKQQVIDADNLEIENEFTIECTNQCNIRCDGISCNKQQCFDLCTIHPIPIQKMDLDIYNSLPRQQNQNFDPSCFPILIGALFVVGCFLFLLAMLFRLPDYNE